MGFGWCREGESNPQGTKYRRILSPLRLPVPPSRPGNHLIAGKLAEPSCVDIQFSQNRSTGRRHAFREEVELFQSAPAPVPAALGIARSIAIPMGAPIVSTMRRSSLLNAS